MKPYTFSFLKFWNHESGWGDGPPILAEGKLAIDAWNAALEFASRQVVIDGNPALARDRILAAKCEVQ